MFIQFQWIIEKLNLNSLVIIFASIFLVSCSGGGDSSSSSGGSGSTCGTVCSVTTVYVIGPGGGTYAYPLCSSTCPVEPANRAPTASIAGPSTLVLGNNIILDSAASDPDADPLSYNWSLLSQPVNSSAIINNTSTEDLSFSPDSVGRYLFSLVVDDGELSADAQYHVVDVEGTTLAGFDLTTIQIAAFSDSAEGVVVGPMDANTAIDVVVGTSNDQIEALTNYDNVGQTFTRNTPADGHPFINSILAVGEFNGDSNSDLVSSNTIIQGDGNGGFSPLTTLPFGAGNMAVGDFNGDGNDDIAVIKTSPDPAIRIMHGDGNGTFSEGFSANSPVEFGPLNVADFNNDNIDDLVYSDILFDANGRSELSVVLGNSSSYGAPFQIDVPGRGGLGTGDINNDGNIDIVMSFKRGTQPNLPPSVTSNVGIGFATILGNGDGTFETLRVFDAATLSRSNIAIYDFNADGYQDFVYRGDTNAINVLMGDGMGGVNDLTILPVSDYFGTGFAVAEIDGDSLPDILISGDWSFNRGELLIAFGIDNQVP
jgi:hypothetical protein